jgi:DnaA family protein
VNVPQLPLALRSPPDQRFESFIDAPEGALPQLRLLAMAQQPDCVYLAGGAGTGKTHLCLSLCAAAGELGRRAAYVPLAAASGRVREALESLDAYEVVAVDGLESVAGNAADELALFDFHNRAKAMQQNLLYTSRLAPDALQVGLPDLRSRLSQCVRLVLQTLDDAGRRALLRDRAQRRGLAVEEAAFDWMLANVERDPVSLVALLDRLDRESLAAQRRVTVPFVRQVRDSPGTG